MEGPDPQFRLGSWVRGGGITGIVTRVDGADVSVFEPGARRMATVDRGEVQAVPAAAVRVRLTVDLPLPHGVGEESLRRWVSALVDPVLRERAMSALGDAGLDVGPGLPEVAVELTPAEDVDAVCLCGARTPTAGEPVACRACGRAAVPPPA